MQTEIESLLTDDLDQLKLSMKCEVYVLYKSSF